MQTTMNDTSMKTFSIKSFETFIKQIMTQSLIDFVKWMIAVEHLFLDLLQDNTTPPLLLLSPLTETTNNEPELIIYPKNKNQRQFTLLLCSYYKMSYKFVETRKTIPLKQPGMEYCCKWCVPRAPVNCMHINRTQKALDRIRDAKPLSIVQIIQQMEEYNEYWHILEKYEQSIIRKYRGSMYDLDTYQNTIVMEYCDNFTALPDDCLQLVLSYVSNLPQVSLLSKQWYVISSDDIFYESRFDSLLSQHSGIKSNAFDHLKYYKSKYISALQQMSINKNCLCKFSDILPRHKHSQQKSGFIVALCEYYNNK
jgi:hypothetical protein